MALVKVGALIENPGLYSYMTGWDNLKLYADVAGTPDDKISEIVAQLGLAEFINKKSEDLFVRDEATRWGGVSNG